MARLDFPKLRQTYEYDCGPKALQSVLAYYGIEISEENLMKLARTNKKLGTVIKGIEKSIESFGLEYDSREMTIKEVQNYINKRIPVLILLQAWNPYIEDYEEDYNDSHWVVAIGYTKKRMYFEDPYSFVTAELTYEELQKRWHAKEKRNIIQNHGIAVYGANPKYNSKKVIHLG